MKKWLNIGLLFTLSFAIRVTFAQPADDHFHFGIYLGPSLPQGDYAATHGISTGYAENGVGAMIDFRKRVSKVDWVSSLIFSTNSTDANAMQNQLTEMGLIADDHFSLWALTGISYRIYLSENVSVYGSGLIGLFYSNYPDIYVTDGINKTTYTYSSASTIGYGIGTGLSVFHINLAIRYCLATPSYSRSGDWLSQDNSVNSVTIPSNNLFIMLGYEF